MLHLENQICKNCAQIFPRPYRGSDRTNKVSWPKYHSMVFCSKSCQAQWREKEKGNYSLTLECEVCGELYENVRGKRKAYSKYCSRSCLGVANGVRVKGENHHNWRGGVTDENHRLRNTSQYKEWRDTVYKRDYWTCQLCSKKPKDIVAHHLKTWNEHPELRYEVSNGQTLCRSCHKKVHYDIGYDTRYKKKQS